MAIRDCSNQPDHMVPEWVRQARQRRRVGAERRREFLKEQETDPYHIGWLLSSDEPGDVTEGERLLAGLDGAKAQDAIDYKRRCRARRAE